MKRLLLAMLLCIPFLRPATGATLQGATLPDSYQAEGQTLLLNGMALRTVTMFNVRAYVVAMYLPQKSREAKQILAMPGPKVVLLKFLHAATKAEVDAQFREGEQKNCTGDRCDRADQGDFERLVAATPAFKVDDTFAYVFHANGVRALVNNRVIGEFANRDLALHLLDGFIGANPPSPTVRAGLLGQD